MFDLIKKKPRIFYWTIWFTKRETKPEKRRQKAFQILTSGHGSRRLKREISHQRNGKRGIM